MFDLFSDLPYYDFPSFSAAIFSILLSFFLSTLVAFTYQKTVRNATYSKNFFQSIALSGMVAATVMMAIGDSLVRGIGILGALAIIRYRTRLTDPRNIIFIFASFTIGIACGVYGYAIAIAGTLSFCVVALILYFSPYGVKSVKDSENALSFSLDDGARLGEVEALLKKRSKHYHLISIASGNIKTKYQFHFVTRSNEDFIAIYEEILTIEGVSNVRVNYRINTEII